MRKILSLLLVFAACIGSITAQTAIQGNNANPVVMNSNKDLHPNIAKNDASFTFDNIEFWAGEGNNKAALVIQWADENTPNTLVWGYRWDGKASGLDMATAIAKADPRLVMLTQYTGSMGSTICGFGYSEEPFKVIYGGEGDKEKADKAIEEGLESGVIQHPFGAEEGGSPEYDYDSWTAEGALHWNAGWFKGYWSYNVRDKQTDNFGYSGSGVSSRMLKDGSWDAWMYSDFSAGMGTLSDTFTAATAVSTDIKDEIISNAKIMANNNVIRLVNMNGYNCVITDIAGKIIKTFTVSNNDDIVRLNANGLYIISAINGNEKVNCKIVVE